MNRRPILLLAGLLLLGVNPFTSANAQNPILMKLGTATVNDSTQKWLEIFAKHVEEDSGGRIKGEVYPGSQLGSSESMIEQVELGIIQGEAGSPEFITGLDSRYQVLSAAGLFKDVAHANRVLQDPKFNKAFLSLGADKRIIGVGLLIGAPTVFATRKPIHTLADFNGLKIRVLGGHMQQAQVRALNMSPVPMSLGDVMPALQQGTLDGVLGGLPVLTALHYYDVAKYIVETNHGLLAAIGIISQKWFASLPPDLQAIVIKDGQKASADVYQFSVDDISRARQKWLAGGGKITKLDAADQATMMKKMEAVSEQEMSANPKDKAIFDLMRSTAERTENSN
jgi:TRAP-type C4-dicarboxylate transport system substrate-binding protein